jgi:hypothetical protein
MDPKNMKKIISEVLWILREVKNIEVYSSTSRKTQIA